MYKLYIFTFRKKDKDILKYENRKTWMGFERSYDKANTKAKSCFPGYKGVWYNEISIFECLHLLPFMPNKHQNEV